MDIAVPTESAFFDNLLADVFYAGMAHPGFVDGAVGFAEHRDDRDEIRNFVDYFSDEAVLPGEWVAAFYGLLAAAAGEFVEEPVGHFLFAGVGAEATLSGLSVDGGLVETWRPTLCRLDFLLGSSAAD